MTIHESTLPDVNSGPEIEKHTFVLYEALEVFERRAFVPFLAIPALLCLTPLGASPLFAALAGALVIWVGVQLVRGYAFPQLPSGLSYMRVSSPVAQRVTDQLVEGKTWLDENCVPRMTWLTTSPVSLLTFFGVICVGIAMPLFALAGSSLILLSAALLLFCVSLVMRDGRYIVMAALVVSFSSVLPILQINA